MQGPVNDFFNSCNTKKALIKGNLRKTTQNLLRKQREAYTPSSPTSKNQKSTANTLKPSTQQKVEVSDLLCAPNLFSNPSIDWPGFASQIKSPKNVELNQVHHPNRVTRKTQNFQRINDPQKLMKASVATTKYTKPPFPVGSNSSIISAPEHRSSSITYLPSYNPHISPAAAFDSTTTALSQHKPNSLTPCRHRNIPNTNAKKNVSKSRNTGRSQMSQPSSLNTHYQQFNLTADSNVMVKSRAGNLKSILIKK